MARIRILLVDDHTLVRAGLRALLESIAGVEVVAEAGSGKEAVELTRDHLPDVVVMDVSMPDMDGLQAAAEIKRELPDQKMMMLSAHSETAIVEQALQVGASGYLVKNAALVEFELCLQAITRGEIYLSPAVARPIVSNYLRKEPRAGASGHGLTPRQYQILQLLGTGKNTKEIARALDLSVKTVEAHRSQLMSRLGVRDIANLILEAARKGLISAGE